MKHAVSPRFREELAPSPDESKHDPGVYPKILLIMILEQKFEKNQNAH
jgi:hypothetical protein